MRLDILLLYTPLFPSLHPSRFSYPRNIVSLLHGVSIFMPLPTIFTKEFSLKMKKNSYDIIREMVSFYYYKRGICLVKTYLGSSKR